MMWDGETRGRSRGRWLMRLGHSGPARARLLCIPHAGAGASAYTAWRRHLPSWVELISIQLPGREARVQEAPVSDFDAVVDAIHAELKTLPPLPYLLFGHSLGALLAFELTHRQLESARALPAALMASACPAPSHTPQLTGLRWDDTALATELLVAHGGTPRAVLEHPELFEHVRKVFMADLRLLSSYRRRKRQALPIPVHVYSGARDVIEPAALAAWAGETSVAFRHRQFEGGHFYTQEQTELLLSELTRELSFAAIEGPSLQGGV